MEKQRIINFILKNPKISKEVLKKNALTQGIPEEEFEEAWTETQEGDAMIVQEEERDFETTLFWIFVAITVAGIVINAAYAAFVSTYIDDFLMLALGYISTFTDAVLGLHLSSRLLLVRESFYKSIFIAVFATVITLLVKGIGLTLIFFSIGIFILIALFVTIMKVFNIGIGKTILLIIMQGVFMYLIQLAMYGLYLVLGLFA